VVEETNERIEAARAAGATIVGRDEGIAVHVAAAVTHTIGGLQVDTQARVSGTEGLWAAGVDAGDVATGGYASGLAQALVLGLAAAESIAAGYPARYAQTRRSPGSGDGASFVTSSCLPSTSTWAPIDGGSPSCSTSS
jgi:aspartate oxidase